MTNEPEPAKLRDAADAIRNIVGDGDNNPDGCITVDWPDPRHPVVRFNKSRLPEMLANIPQEELKDLNTTEVDGVSIDANGSAAQGEDDSGDDDGGVSGDETEADGDSEAAALQIKDFNGSASDSPKGLAQRLEVDKESGKVHVTGGANIMLIARRNGKIAYIPLTADGDDEEDDNPEEEAGEDPCDHPGDTGFGGGVDPNDGSADSSHSNGGGIGIGGGIGGVSASDDSGVHPGDDNCNCD